MVRVSILKKSSKKKNKIKQISAQTGEVKPSRRWKLLKWLCNSQHNLKLALGNVYVHADSPTAAENKLPKTRTRNKPSHLRTAWLSRALYMTSAKRSSRQTREQNESKRKIHAGSVNLISCLTCSHVKTTHMSTDIRHQTCSPMCFKREDKKKKPTGQKKNSRMGQGSWVSDISRLNSCRSRTSVEPLLSQPEGVRKHDWTNQRPLRR